MTTGRPLDDLVRAYLAEDDFNRVGLLVHAHPELLDEPAARLIGRTAPGGSRGGRRPAEQHTRFLARCRADPRAVFPPGSTVIDPTCYALVADRHEAAERAEEEFTAAGTPALRAERAGRWADAWDRVLGEPGLAGAHPALLATLLNDAGRAGLMCYFAVGGVRYLEQARTRLERAVALTPGTSVRAASRRSNLGLVLLERADTPGAPEPVADRAEAMRLLRDAARTAPPLTTVWADCHLRLAQARLRAFEESDRIGHLNAAVRDLTAVWQAGATDEDTAHTLGCVLRRRHAARGGDDDLDLAVALLSAAALATPATAPELLRRQLDLGVALLDRHRRDADAADLEEAGAALRTAVAAAPDTSPDRPAAVGHWAGYWYRRFEATGSMADLDTALRLAREAAGSPAARAGERVVLLVNLAVITEETARQSADRALFDEALAAFAEVLAAGPPAAFRRTVLAATGGAWRDRFGVSRDGTDLARAVDCLRQAHADVPPRSPDAARIGLAWALALFEWYVVTVEEGADEEPGADEGGGRGRGDGGRDGGAGEPVAEVPAAPGGAPGAPEDGPALPDGRAGLLEALAVVRGLARRRTPLLDRHRIRAAQLVLTLVAAEAGLVRASPRSLRRTVRQVWADGARTDPEMLWWTGSLWGRWASAERRPRDAALGFRIAVETLNALARAQSDPGHGARWLRSGGRLTSEAAYASATAGRHREAVRLMETGRLVLLTEALTLRSARIGDGPAGLPGELLDRLADAKQRVRAAEHAARTTVRTP
ncbi:hypothetical protein ACFCX4_24185 [Kitasatospora sp. NPDC056327]|uniref:hypothetical protein n=1 Tax=Kitasatospora sp. NPDC056327 TaxID=3345785 RepID=UPI0035DEA9FC